MAKKNLITRAWVAGGKCYNRNESRIFKKSSALKISGSNPLLKNRRIEFRPIPPSDALRASLKKFLKTNDVLCLSRWPDSNRRPTPYHGVALPTELHRQHK